MLRYILFLSSFFIGTLRALTPQEIDQIAEQTLKEWNIPGLSVAVIHKGETIQIKGYGVLENGSDKPVDTQTLFQINSLSKAFTALTVDKLVKEGKIDWDIPITAYFPNFQSLSPEVTKSLSLRDLLSHQGGFPGNLYEGWRLYRNTEHSVEELVRRLAFVNITFPFRTRFNYDNLGYAMASEVIANVSDISWADYCHQEIFLPLNMTRTTTSYSKFFEDKNAASPHTYPKAEKVDGYNWEKDGMEAASGINSCADDMAKWLNYCLNNPSVFLETQKPHIAIYPEDMVFETELPLFAIMAHGQPHMHYGLGWWSYQLDELSVYRHTGGSYGMQSVLAIIPEKQIGIVILNNTSHTPAMSCMMNILIDKLLEKPDSEWHELGHQAFKQKKKNQENWLEECQAKRNPDLLRSFPLIDYVGTYTHLAYGPISIEEKEGKLTVEFLFYKDKTNPDKGFLEHWEKDQFEMMELPSISLRPFICEFLTEENTIIGLTIPDLGFFERHK